ncbi:hypothetical protein [Nonomuraea indica]|uniref:hypothetical protein n=1 Tax=Nonomuraea indica TaxID=1581193 RepID=UPI001FE7F4F8|nr:hypothetical protein [Nonomuraea indica]
MTQHLGPEAGDGPLDTPARYAQAVRTALAGHPDAEELLDDLDDHLAEIAAESEVPLVERLGPPAAYAEELVAAYGGRPASRQKRRLRPLERLRDLHVNLMGKGPYRGFVGFLPELRPGWWVLRGYLLAMILAGFADDLVVPGDALGWLLVVAFAAASVWWGRSARGRLALRGGNSRLAARRTGVWRSDGPFPLFDVLAQDSEWRTADRHPPNADTSSRTPHGHGGLWWTIRSAGGVGEAGQSAGCATGPQSRPGCGAGRSGARRPRVVEPAARVLHLPAGPFCVLEGMR